MLNDMDLEASWNSPATRRDASPFGGAWWPTTIPGTSVSS